MNQFAAQGLNAVLYYQNKDFKSWVSLVPTSAHSGEGIPDLLMLLVQLTQRMMKSQLGLSDSLGCTVRLLAASVCLFTLSPCVWIDSTLGQCVVGVTDVCRCWR